MSEISNFAKRVLVSTVVIVSSNVFAGGFQLNAYSAAGLGRAYSGEGAMVDSVTSASRNPATMMMFSQPELSNGIFIGQPDADVSGPSPPQASIKAPAGWVPNFHYVHPLNEQFAMGGSVTSNYGIETEFNDGTNEGKNNLATLNLNLSGAYRLNQHFSFGLGFNAVYAKAKLEYEAGQSGAILGVPADTQIEYLKGDRWGYGWNAGMLFEIDNNNRYGFTYRSKVEIDLKGDYKSSLSSDLNQQMRAATLPWGTDGKTIPGQLTLNLPEMWEISGYNKVSPRWAVHYNVAYTRWSQFQELKATGENGQNLFLKKEGYKDAYQIALGTTYFYDENWVFRSGIAFDESPVPAQRSQIASPAQDRLSLSAGTMYRFDKNISIDLGVSYLRGLKSSIEEAGYKYNSELTCWLYGVNLNYKF